MALVVDRLGRPQRSLRISVTDRCNLRCTYCMPERDYVWLPKSHLLTFAEIARLCACFAACGVDRVRLTGGEPLIRTDLPVLVRMLRAVPGIDDIALTTNGVLLPQHGKALRDAGLDRVTISLDTLDPERFSALAGRDRLADVLAGLDAAAAAGFAGTKLNMVVVRGQNDNELAAMLRFGKERRAEVRFIEYMDVGGATGWRRDLVVPRAEILATIARELGPFREVASRDSAPADRFALDDGTTFGVIASTTSPFCRSCDRSRITADGMWYGCLYAKHGQNLRDLLRGGASDAEVVERIAGAWRERDDRGAEHRLALRERGALALAAELRSDPHLEMHTRGG